MNDARAYPKSTRQIIKEIGCPHLSLYHGKGYWYFAYDDGEIFETESIPVSRLRSMPLEHWIGIGRRFASETQERKR